ETALIGGSDASIDKERVFLRPIDTRLGVPLLNRLRGLCSAETDRCAVWLDGYWGAEMELPGLEPAAQQDDGWPFTVTQIHALGGDKESEGTPPPRDSDLRVGVAASRK
ncbi:MAG: hypothetical protein VX498_07630, partial [Myxococcota bacterium]|nr:hypothetical protein [Myxococcota bacterium]